MNVMFFLTCSQFFLTISHIPIFCFLNVIYISAKDEQPEILSSSVLFFFKLFIGVSGLLMKHILELKSMFGKVSNNNADQIYKVIHNILVSLLLI